MGNFARTDRVAQQIQREIAELVRLEINDPRVRLVTITGVEVAGDYSHAKVFFTRLDGKHEEALQGLESASGFLRKHLAHPRGVQIAGAGKLVSGLHGIAALGVAGAVRRSCHRFGRFLF